MPKKKQTKKARVAKKKSKRSGASGKLLAGTMLAGGVELVSQDVWAQACHADWECGPPPWTCSMGANECDNFCYYP